MELGDVPCTKCGKAGGLEIFSKLEVQTDPTYSIAGEQVKLNAKRTPWMRCNYCKAECKGKLVDS